MEFYYHASKYLSDISVHTSYVGCDPMTEREKARYKLSIHASHAGCDASSFCCCFPFSLSIHASHAGCDQTEPNSISVLPLFQSTHPMRDATLRLRKIQLTVPFQSTHPMRDATFPVFVLPKVNLISIHASHAGCDFNWGASKKLICISIHASHAGCDATCWYRWSTIAISIHASHAGCDTSTTTLSMAMS